MVLGIDVKNKYIPHTSHGIATVDMDKRERDANFYEGMPMVTFEKDPANHTHDEEKKNNLMETLRQNLREAQETPEQLPLKATRSTEPPQPIVKLPESSFFSRLKEDMKRTNWTSMRECKNLLDRDNRFEYMIAFLLFFVFISFLIHSAQ